MCRCSLCFPFTRHEAEYAVSYGCEDRLLRVCRYCEQDLTFFGMRFNQVVRLPEASRHVRRFDIKHPKKGAELEETP